MDVVVQLNEALQDRYDVEREIGAGGMATVYLARDLKHKRKVALKVLRPDLGAVLGAERFLSEIQVTANLQHPNLLPLFDSGEADGYLFYVMPFVEGESLRARLDREKQLPLDDALHIATAVASALDYAHRHQVIHRDLKPENILLHEGQPLVADFGIALAVSNAGGNRVTQTGLSLGTPQYMSPEQATGDRVIDGRTDIYSLGAVTYEMLTGESPHTGNTSQAVIARLLTEAPRAIRVTRPIVPEHVEAAVERALAKLPADRFSRAQEFADAITGKTVMAATMAARSAPQPSERLKWRTVLRHPVALVLLLLALLGAAGSRKAWQLARSDATETAVRFVLDFPDESWTDRGGTPFALSPDGRLLVFVGHRGANAPAHLFVRPLDDLRTQELAGTDGASQPVFSPDGKWIAFYADGQLKKVPVSGGTAVLLASAPAVNGVSWQKMDELLISSGAAIATVSAQGGALRLLPSETDQNATDVRTEGTLARPITKAAGAFDTWPLGLPDGKRTMFMRWTGGALKTAHLAVAPIGNGSVSQLDLTGTQPLGILDNYLVYAALPGVIMAVPFNVRTMRPTGTPVPVINGVEVGRAGAFKGGLSANGSLVYATGGFAQQLAIAEPAAAPRPLLPDVREFAFPRFSPDGRHVAMAITSGDVSDIWILDLPSGPLRKLTSGATFNFRPEWTPDSHNVLFVSNRLGKLALFTQPADGNTPASLFFKLDGVDIFEGVIARDGNYLILQRDSTGSSGRTVFRAQHGDTTLHVLAAADEGQQTAARISPDGHWVAYQSDELGSMQIYVKPFPQLDTRYQISLQGGEQPVWSPDGRHLFYLIGDRLMSATLSLSPTLAVARRDTVFADGVQGEGEYHAQYDIAPDGKQFVFMRGGAPAQVVVVHNWIRELRTRMAAATSH